MTQPNLHTEFKVKLNGADASSDMMADLRAMETDASMYYPSMITLEFHDPKAQWVDDATLKVGAELELLGGQLRGTAVSLLKGEITAIEPHFTPDGAMTLRLTALDRGHRLHDGRKTKSYLQMTDSDIVSSVASAAGLQAQSDATTEVHKYVLQDNITDFEFLQQRARMLGYYLRVEGTALHFKKWSTLASGSAVATLQWGVELFEFRPRLTATSQANEVAVRAWDPLTKAAVVGTATSAQMQHTLSINGYDARTTGIATPGKITVVDMPVATQSFAQSVAQAMLNEVRNGDIYAEGEAIGNAAIKVGSLVEIQNVGTRFSGKYVLTRVQHRYDYERGWITRFEATNGASASTGNLLMDGAGTPRDHEGFGHQLVVGIVTNNADPDDKYRVKVKFPWLDDQVESNWARVVTPMAGGQRGIQFMPEVNDEVLIGFEHGDVNRPYVVGALWNGTDAAPMAKSVYLEGGQIIVREIKTRVGHIIRLTDKSGQEKIEVIDKTGSNKITIDSTKNEIDVEAQTKVFVKAAEVAVEATGKVSMKGATVEVNASGMMKLEAGGVVEVKGATIKLN